MVVLSVAVVMLGQAGVRANAEDTRSTPASGVTPTRVDVVGNATLIWHFNAGRPSARAAALIDRFRQVTAAHLTGAEFPPAREPAPVMMLDGGSGQPVPVELIPTMFYHVEEGAYCSDSSAPSPYAREISEEPEE